MENPPLHITKKQGKVLFFMVDHYKQYGVSPTCAEIADHFDLDYTSHAGYYLKQLREKDLIMRNPKMSVERKYKPTTMAIQLYEDARKGAQQKNGHA